MKDLINRINPSTKGGKHVLKKGVYATILGSVLLLGSCEGKKFTNVDSINSVESSKDGKKYLLAFNTESKEKCVINEKEEIIFSHPDLDQVQQSKLGLEVCIKDANNKQDYIVGLIGFDGKEIIAPSSDIDFFNYHDGMILTYQKNPEGFGYLSAVYDAAGNIILPLGQNDIGTGKLNNGDEYIFYTDDKGNDVKITNQTSEKKISQ